MNFFKRLFIRITRKTHKTFGVSLALRSNDDILVLQSKIYPQMLFLPGGKVEQSESDFHALQREIKEELGFRINYDNTKLISYDLVKVKTVNGKTIYSNLACYEQLRDSLSVETFINNEPDKHERIFLATKYDIIRLQSTGFVLSTNLILYLNSLPGEKLKVPRTITVRS